VIDAARSRLIVQPRRRERFELLILDRRRAHLAASMLEEGVSTDRRQPSPAVRARLEGVPVAIGAEKRLLHEIVRVGFVASERDGDAFQRCEVRKRCFGEGAIGRSGRSRCRWPDG